jgi:hypothetical protein
MHSNFTPHGIFLSRRNLLTLLSKLDRKAAGDSTECTIIKRDNTHAKYPQSMPFCVVQAIEDDEYYDTRNAGDVHPLDEPTQKNMV